jgi:hypothetical protein
MSRPAIKTPALAERIRDALQNLSVSTISIQRFKTSGGFSDTHPNLFTDALTLALRGSRDGVPPSRFERRDRTLFKRMDLTHPKPAIPAVPMSYHAAYTEWKDKRRAREIPQEVEPVVVEEDWSHIKSGADF